MIDQPRVVSGCADRQIDFEEAIREPSLKDILVRGRAGELGRDLPRERVAQLIAHGERAAPEGW